MTMLASMFALLSVASASPEPWTEGTQVRAPRTAAGWVQGAFAPGPNRYFFGDLAASTPFLVNERGNLGLGGHLGVSGTHWAIAGEDRSGLGFRNVNGELWLWAGNPDKATTHGFFVGYGTRGSAAHGGYLLSPVESAHRMYLGYDGYIDWGRWDLGYLLRTGLNDRTLMEMTADITVFHEFSEQVAASMGFYVGVSPTMHFMPGVRWRPPMDDDAMGLELALSAAVPSYFEEMRADRTALLLNVKLYDRRPR